MHSVTNLNNPQLQQDNAQPPSVSSQRFSETDLEETVRRQGTSAELGFNYEKKILLLALYRAIKMKYDFTLDTNVEGAGAFDDVVFTYKENGIMQRIYLQAKHKEKTENKINYEDFLQSGNKPFALYKYFIDYLEIIKQFDDKGGIVSKYFIIYTNVDFNRSKSDDEVLLTHKKSGDYFLFGKLDFSKHRSLHIFSSIGCRRTKQHASFYQFSDRNGANDVNERARVVKVLIQKFKEIDKKFKKLQKFSAKELNSKLEGYLNSLVLAVNQPGENALGNQIEKEVSDTYPGSLTQDQVRFMFAYALNKISDWKARKRAKPLTESDNYFKQGEETFKAFPGLYPVLIYENQLGALPVEFVEDLYMELSDFFSSRKQLWVISSETPWLNSLVIYLALKDETIKQKTGINYVSHDHHLLLSLSDLLDGYEYILKRFKAMEQSLLIIECESRELMNPKLPEIVNEIVQIVSASENTLKQVIVIAPGKHDLSVQLMEKLFSSYTKQHTKIEFSHLVKTSQEICLAAQKIHFQGSVELFSIKQLLGLDEDLPMSENSLANFNIDALELERILKSSILEIGNEKPYLSELESTHYKTNSLIEIEQLKNAFAPNTGDIFAFVGDKKEVIELLPSDRQQELIRFEDGLLPVKSNFVLLKTGREVEQFKQLCHQIDEARIEKEAKNDAAQSALHLLKRRIEGWVWVRSYSQDFYMKRCFFPVVVDKEKLRNDMSKLPSSHIFVFSGITKETLLESLRSKNENEKGILEKITFAYPQESDAENAFERFRSRYHPRKSIHWLKVNTESDQREFQWHRSEGKMNQLRSILKEEKVDGTKLESFNERMLVKSEARFIVLADAPGMGKSTTLMHMAELMKKKNPLLWLIKIDLNRYQSVLADSRVGTLKSLVHLLSEIDRKLVEPLTCSILMYKLTCPNHVVFLCDGFDEVKPEKQEALLALFEYIKSETAARVFVTTRRHDQRILEERFSVFAYPFQPLDKANQIKFLTCFWETALKLLTHEKKDLSVLRSYASEVIDLFEHSIRDYKNSFISIPLRARMLAEVWQDSVLKALAESKHSLRSFQTEEQLGITNLYQQFIDRKLNIFLREKVDAEGLGEESSRNLMLSYTDDYECLAVKEFFDLQEIAPFFRDKISYSLNALSRVGLIQGNEEFMNFTHRTFMEYFAAKWLAKHAENEEVKKFLCVKLFKKESEVLRRFFDRFLTQDLLLHRSVLDSDSSPFLKLLSENCDVGVKDVLGRTALHLAAQESRTEMIKQLLEVSDDIFVRDHMGKTPLHYSVSIGNDIVVGMLLDIDIDLKDDNFRTPLHVDTEVKAFFNNSKYEESTLKNLVNERDKAGKSPLYYAAQNEHWMTVDIMLFCGADCSVLTIEQVKKLVDVRAFYPADFADCPFVKFPEDTRDISFDAKLDLLVRYYLLVHIKVIDVVLSCTENEEDLIYLLDILVDKSDFISNDAYYLEIVRYFNEQGRRKLGINITKIMPRLFNHAVEFGFVKSFEYLWQCTIDIADLDKAKYIQDKKEDLINIFSNMHGFDPDDKWFQKFSHDCCEALGWKRLHLAAMDKHASSIEGYLKPPIYENINIRDKEGCTPLIYASCIAGRSDFIESLFLALKKNNVNDKNKLYEIINAEDQFGRTPLYWVVRNRDLDSTEILLKHIVDAAFSPDQLFTIINYKDNDDSIASILFSEVLTDETEFSELLINFLKSLNLSSKQWAEFLNVSYNSLPGRTCFISKKALILLNFIENLPLDDDDRARIINRMYDGKTALHEAAWSGECYEVVCSLLRNGAIYNACDAKQKTPLDNTSESPTSNDTSKNNFLLGSVDRLFELIVDEQLTEDTEKLDELKETLKILKNEAGIDSKCISKIRNGEGKTLLNLSSCQKVTDLLLE